MVVFDLDQPRSFSSLVNWINEARDNSPPECILGLIGNKVRFLMRKNIEYMIRWIKIMRQQGQYQEKHIILQERIGSYIMRLHHIGAERKVKVMKNHMLKE